MRVVAADATPSEAGERRPAVRREFTARSGLTALIYLAPAAIVVAVFTYYPMVRGSQMAFREWNLADLTSTPWIGLENFASLFEDPIFHTVLTNTVFWVLGSLLPQFILGFALALLLWRRFPLRGAYQALVFFPWAVSGFLIGLLFRWMFNAEFGVVNDLLRKVGLIDQAVPWLADPDLARFSVIIANVWYGVTFFTIMILAALQSVPAEMLEAGSIDGAGKTRSLFSLVIPSIRTTLVLTVLLRTIWIFNFPDIIYGMTGGGPAHETDIVVTWMINLTLQGNYGRASALGLLAVGTLTVFAIFYLAALKSERRP